MTRIGLISDTHGLLRPEALAALAGVTHIVHGGDVGGPAVLAGLSAIAEVTAVRGNNDTDGWSQALPLFANRRFGDVGLHVLHDIADYDGERARGARVVVTGHSHRPAMFERDGVLFVNPGSAGPRRFRLPVTVALLEIDGAKVGARIVELAVAPSR